MNQLQAKTDKTVKDFGDQWTTFKDNTGYYGSLGFFHDFVHPLLKVEDFKGKNVADIGSGTGRIVNMILDAGAKHVWAVEPSECFWVLQKNIGDRSSQVSCLNVTGEKLSADEPLDCVVSFGVLHHIPEPDAVVKNAYDQLKPGGKMLIWLYGKEGNGLYLAFAEPLRWFTQRMPHFMLNALTFILGVPLHFYAKLCKYLPLPMKHYMVNTINSLEFSQQRITIYDQLNPAYAKYYKKEEARNLLVRAGFKDVQLHHRHGYSWTVLGIK